MSQRFRITVRGRLSERFAARFTGLDREGGGDQDTVLVGDFRDPTQLDALLGRIADCGLELVGVEEAAGERPSDPTGAPPSEM